jgi:hypothetical protein
MTMTAVRIAVSASVLVLSAGAALSDTAPDSGTRLASLDTQCTTTQAQVASPPLGLASTTARHTNVIRVRYAAAHAMPAKRNAIVAQAGCTSPVKSANTALD